MSCAAARPAQSCREISSALSPRKAADPPQKRAEVLAVHVFHREEVLPPDLADVVHAADVRVRDLARETDLREESLDTVAVRRQVRRQELQRDRLAELQVIGAVDLPHAAAPEESDDPVALGEDRPRREAAGVDRVRRREPPHLRRGRRPLRLLRHRRRRQPRRHLRDRRDRLAARAAEARRLRNAGPAARAGNHGARILSNRHFGVGAGVGIRIIAGGVPTGCAPGVGGGFGTIFATLPVIIGVHAFPSREVSQL